MFKNTNKLLFSALIASLLPTFAVAQEWEQRACVRGVVHSTGEVKGEIQSYQNFDVKTAQGAEEFLGCFTLGAPSIALVGTTILNGHCKIQFDVKAKSDTSFEKLKIKVVEESNAACSVHQNKDKTVSITYKNN